MKFQNNDVVFLVSVTVNGKDRDTIKFTNGDYQHLNTFASRTTVSGSGYTDEVLVSMRYEVSQGKGKERTTTTTTWESGTALDFLAAAAAGKKLSPLPIILEMKGDYQFARQASQKVQERIDNPNEFGDDFFNSLNDQRARFHRMELEKFEGNETKFEQARLRKAVQVERALILMEQLQLPVAFDKIRNLAPDHPIRQFLHTTTELLKKHAVKFDGLKFVGDRGFADVLRADLLTGDAGPSPKVRLQIDILEKPIPTAGYFCDRMRPQSELKLEQGLSQELELEQGSSHPS